MKFTIKQKNSEETVFSVDLEISDGKIMFPTDFNVPVFLSMSQDSACDRDRFSVVIRNIFFLDSLHSLIENVMNMDQDDIQNGFVDFVEKVFINTRSLSWALNADFNADFESSTEMISSIFWPIVERIMKKVEDSSGGYPDDLESLSRRELFCGIIESNEEEIRKIIKESEDEDNNEHTEFYDFLTQVVNDVTDDKKVKNNRDD